MSLYNLQLLKSSHRREDNSHFYNLETISNKNSQDQDSHFSQSSDVYEVLPFSLLRPRLIF